MITRIAVALFALYLVHGSENTARDGSRLAEDLRREAPKAAVSLCLDHAATCGTLAAKAADMKTGNLFAPVVLPKDPAAPTAEAVAPDLYPLPPRRPGGLAKRA